MRSRREASKEGKKLLSDEEKLKRKGKRERQREKGKNTNDRTRKSVGEKRKENRLMMKR